MGRFLSAALFLATAIHQSAAHFLLHYPATVGFDDDLEGTAPCGSFTPDFTKDNVTDFHVAGDSIALTSTHPATTWLFRATLDQTAGGNWTDILPAVSQTGLGNFCERDLEVPSSWTGQKGIIQIVQDAVDGFLYQCAAVNFVNGTLAPPSVCQNVTGLTANYTSDAAFSSIPASAAPTASGSASGSASAATASATGSTSPSGSATASASSSSSSSTSAAVKTAGDSYRGMAGSAMLLVLTVCATMVSFYL